MSFRFLAILVFTCLLQPTAWAQTASPRPRPAGAGGFPVSFTHASAWFVDQADDNAKHLPILVYFEGEPLWHERTTNFRWELNQSPATIEMTVGRTQIVVSYWWGEETAEILGSKFSLASANVFLVEGVDGTSPLVIPLGYLPLSFAPRDNPAIVLLQRIPELRAALAHQAFEKPANTPAQDEMIDWDREGLRLLASNHADEQREACDLFARAAARGYAKSQYRLGYCYERGAGRDQDFVVANHWYEKAARQGHVDAQYKLGHSYRVGRGTEVDLSKSIRWYRMAAENNDAEAQHNLGSMYATGAGVQRDPKEAFSWFLRAAQNGEAGSQFEVARRLDEGDGVTADPAASYVWLLVLKAQKRDFAPDAWQTIQEFLGRIEKKLDASSRAEAEVESNELLRKLARAYIARLRSE